MQNFITGYKNEKLHRTVVFLEAEKSGLEDTHTNEELRYFSREIVRESLQHRENSPILHNRPAETLCCKYRHLQSVFNPHCNPPTLHTKLSKIRSQCFLRHNDKVKKAFRHFKQQGFFETTTQARRRPKLVNAVQAEAKLLTCKWKRTRLYPLSFRM